MKAKLVFIAILISFVTGCGNASKQLGDGDGGRPNFSPQNQFELEAALSSANSGETILLPDKEITITSTLKIGKNVQIIGGKNTVIVNLANPLFRIDNTESFSMKGIRFKHEAGRLILGSTNIGKVNLESIEIIGDAPTQYESGIPIHISNAKDVSILNCTLEDNFGAIYVLNTEKIKVQSNTLESNSYGNCVLSGGLIEVFSNKILNAGAFNAGGKGNGDALTINGGKKVFIIGNQIESPLCYGMWFVDACDEIVIQNNTIRDGITGSIYFTNYSNKDHFKSIRIENNIMDNQAWSWGLMALIDSVVIKGNKLIDIDYEMPIPDTVKGLSIGGNIKERTLTEATSSMQMKDLTLLVKAGDVYKYDLIDAIFNKEVSVRLNIFDESGVQAYLTNDYFLTGGRYLSGTMKMNFNKNLTVKAYNSKGDIVGESKLTLRAAN